MGDYYCVELADVLRAAGLRVGEGAVNAGWQTRARSSGGWASKASILGVFWHHTASSTTPERDLAFMVNGTGHPIGNMLIDRTGKCWPVAAGASNCAGKGGPSTFSRGTIPVDLGNTRGWQIEVANNGIGEVWPVAQVDAFFAASNALNAHFGNLPIDVVTHSLGDGDGWTNRKIDPARATTVQGPWRPRPVNSSGTWSLADIRSECVRRAKPVPVPPPDKEDDVKVVEVGVPDIDARFLGHVVTQQSTAGVSDFILWVEWVNGADPNQLARLESYRKFGVPTKMIQLGDFKGVGLIGPVPSGDKTHDWRASDFGNVIG